MSTKLFHEKSTCRLAYVRKIKSFVSFTLAIKNIGFTRNLKNPYACDFLFFNNYKSVFQ
jgi:hypothetical protein